MPVETLEIQSIAEKSPTEAEILAQIHSGNAAGREKLLRGYQDIWYRFCLGMLADPDQACEAVQETALRVLENLAGFKGQSTLKTWSLGIALNVCRENKRRFRLTALPFKHRCREETSEPAEKALGRTEQCRYIRRQIGQLPPRQREVITLRYFEELSIEETARIMGCSPGTVKAATVQALRRLKKNWRDEP